MTKEGRVAIVVAVTECNSSAAMLGAAAAADGDWNDGPRDRSLQRVVLTASHQSSCYTTTAALFSLHIYLAFRTPDIHVGGGERVAWSVAQRSRCYRMPDSIEELLTARRKVRSITFLLFTADGQAASCTPFSVSCCV